jgi:cell division protein FtsB
MLDDRPIQAQERIDKYANQQRQQFVALMVMFVVVAIIIGALYLIQATTNVTNARDIQNLREDRARLERDIELLRAENAELNSIPYLREQAATLGFQDAIPGENLVWVQVDGYAYNAPAPTLTPVRITATPRTYDDNFAGWLRERWDWLRDQFNNWAEE